MKSINTRLEKLELINKPGAIDIQSVVIYEPGELRHWREPASPDQIGDDQVRVYIPNNHREVQNDR